MRQNRKRAGDCSPALGFSPKRFPLLLLGGSFLGGLEGVDFRVYALDFHLAVGSQIAKTAGPLAGRRRSGRADLTDGALGNAITPLTLFDDGLAGVTFENATTFCPEGTLGTGKNRLALHGIDLRVGIRPIYLVEQHTNVNRKKAD
jgi:hypothetical protein